MNELITSAVFLASSLYGSGHVAATIQSAPIDSQTEVQASSTQTIAASSLKTAKAQVTTPHTANMEAYLREQFGDEDAILVDIARCESGFHQFDTSGNIIRGIVNQADIGVMQINEKYHAETAKKLGLDLYTVEGNVAYAKHLYEEQGSAPWKSSSKCWAGDLAQK